MSKKDFEKHFNDYLYKHPQLMKADKDSLYTLTGTGYESAMRNIFIVSANDTCVFTISYIGDTTYWQSHKTCEIALVNASKYKQVLKLDSELGFFEKKHFIKIFEENFINKFPIKPIEDE